MDENNKDEENNNQLQTASWWSSWPSWIQTAKEKSSTALEFMKRDLSEFTQVVHTDAAAAVSSTAAMLKEKLTVDNAEAVAGKARQSISSVIESITEVFVPHKEEDDAELMIIHNSKPVVMDWWQKQLFFIRKDPKTFCHEPEGPPEMYENWLESFNLSEHQDEMTEIMMISSDVQQIYDKLVPASVSHLEFWQRYFYRVHLLHKAEAKRAELMRKADQISMEDFEWDKTESKLNSEDKTPIENQLEEEEAASQNPNQKQSLSNSETLEKTLPPTEPSPQSPPQHSSAIKDEADPQSEASSDESRSSPIESLGKESSTTDDWEKDFELELNENDLKKLNSSAQSDSNKEEEDDWEKWQ